MKISPIHPTTPTALSSCPCASQRPHAGDCPAGSGTTRSRPMAHSSSCNNALDRDWECSGIDLRELCTKHQRTQKPVHNDSSIDGAQLRHLLCIFALDFDCVPKARKTDGPDPLIGRINFFCGDDLVQACHSQMEHPVDNVKDATIQYLARGG